MARKGTSAELNKRYEEMTVAVRADCTFKTELVGGQPADDEGLRQFIHHHLGITDPTEALEAFNRITTEEIVDVTPAEGEIEERLSYGVRTIRNSGKGPWLGDWQIKACSKQACSLVDLFSTVRRSKAFLAEGGSVEAVGDSLVEPDHPERVYLVLPEGATTTFKKFHGRVRVGMAMKSIVHDSETAPPGTRFSFILRMLPALKDQDIVDFLALMCRCGLGSARSLERGHVDIDYEIFDPAKPRVKPEKKKLEMPEAKAVESEPQPAKKPVAA